jgi:hypothetical protein
MQKNSPGNSHEKTKLSSNATTGGTIPHPIATMGRFFGDGGMIELVRSNQQAVPELLLFDGEKSTRGASVSYNGRQYEPARIDRTLLEHLTLPTKCYAHRSTGELRTGICRVIANFVGLGEKYTDIAGRIVLGTAMADSMPIAPALLIVGPDVDRGDQFMNVLHCLCRHALPLTGVSPASFRSLPSGGRFTFLITQPTLSYSLQNLFDDASKRDQKIPSRGGLLDLFGVQIFRSESFLENDCWPYRSIKIPMIHTGQAIPPFDQETQERIASEFQAKLLDFRRTKLTAARSLTFDASKFNATLRNLARSLATATPDDRDLQAEIFDLLRDQNEDLRSARWIDPSVIAVEALLVACNESPGEMMYVAELSRLAEATLRGRGEEATIDPGVFGKRLKLLGFVTEPRDARGVQLQLTDKVRNHALALARELGAPESENGRAGSAHVADDA